MPFFRMPIFPKPSPDVIPTLLAALLVSLGMAVHAGETDQFLTWEIELRDSAPAFNEYLDEEIRHFVARSNRKNRRIEDVDQFTQALFRHLFQGLHASRVRRWLNNSDEVDRFPADEISDFAYQRRSVFRRPAFPFVLPMAQTIRVGEVYCGIDKIGHMLGFGRRYHQIYGRHRERGVSHDEALEKTVQWGLRHESSVVGKLVDGIFSHGDLEANYQGLRLALAFSGGPSPLFYREEGRWQYRGDLDIRDYITPDFDESYNLNHYAAWRHKQVAPELLKHYRDGAEGHIVRARFERYREGWHPSRSKEIIDAYFSDRGETPQHLCWLDRDCDAAT